MAKGAYGARKAAQADSLRSSGDKKTMAGLTGVAAGTALLATPAAVAGGAIASAGALMAQDGQKEKRIARSTQAKGTAVDGLAAKGRGGSVVVGQHGGGSRLTPGQATQFSQANAQFKSQQHNASVGADAHAGMKGGGSKLGFGNANNQKAAQAAKAAKRGQ